MHIPAQQLGVGMLLFHMRVPVVCFTCGHVHMRESNSSNSNAEAMPITHAGSHMNMAAPGAAYHILKKTLGSPFSLLPMKDPVRKPSKHLRFYEKPEKEANRKKPS